MEKEVKTKQKKKNDTIEHLKQYIPMKNYWKTRVDLRVRKCLLKT